MAQINARHLCTRVCDDIIEHHNGMMGEWEKGKKEDEQRQEVNTEGKRVLTASGLLCESKDSFCHHTHTHPKTLDVIVKRPSGTSSPS